MQQLELQCVYFIILEAFNINPRSLNKLPHLQNHLTLCVYCIWWRFAYQIDNASILMGCSRAQADWTGFSTVPNRGVLKGESNEALEDFGPQMLNPACCYR